MKNYKKFIVISVFVLVTTPLVVGAMLAKKNDNVSIKEDVFGNLYVAGNMVVVESTINGDVFAAGNNIVIKGTVNGDVFAVANNIDISGIVNGNLRVLSSNMDIEGKVERSVLAAADNLNIEKNALVGRHVTFAGVNLITSGYIGGEVNQWKMTGKQAKKEILGGFFALLKLVGLFGVLAAALILAYLLPKLTDKVYEHMHEKFWSNFGIGLVAVVVIPVVCVFLFMSVLGISLALVSAAMYLVGIFFGKVLAVIGVGKFITGKLNWNLPGFLMVLLGGLIFFGVSLIPFVGGFATLIVVLSAIGGLIKAQGELVKKWR